MCWPSPPDRDEWLQPCRLLADEIGAPTSTTDSADQVMTEILGVGDVPVWRGVHHFRLRRGDTAIATADGHPCGYRRRVGRGLAMVLGGWLAADSVMGRSGEVFDSEAIPDVAGKAFGALAPEVLRVLGDETLPDGAAEQGIVYAYTNQRRGGEVVSGGVLAYFDGERPVGLVELNTTTEAYGAKRFPYHPVLPVHSAALRKLIGRPPRVRVDHPHVQARILDGPGPEGPATVVLVNRWPEPAALNLRTRAGGHQVRMSLRLPGRTGLACPVDWPLPNGWTLRHATASLTGVESRKGGLRLRFHAPAGGTAVLSHGSLRHRLRLRPGEHWVGIRLSR